MKGPRVPAVLLVLLFLFCCGLTHGWGQGGSIDPSFSSSANGVLAICQQSDGKILVGGSFTQIGTTAITRIARLDQDGTVDPTFNPGSGPNGSVLQIAIQSDGRILIAGQFSQVGTGARSGIARLNTDGSLDPILLLAALPGRGL